MTEKHRSPTPLVASRSPQQQELIFEWGDKSAELVQAYFEHLTPDDQVGFAAEIAQGRASIRLDGSIFPTRLKIFLLRETGEELLADILGGDAAPPPGERMN